MPFWKVSVDRSRCFLVLDKSQASFAEVLHASVTNYAVGEREVEDKILIGHGCYQYLSSNGQSVSYV